MQKPKLYGYSKMKAQSRTFYVQVLRENTENGLTPAEIARKYINPRTGNFYTRQHIYRILKDIRTGKVKI